MEREREAAPTLHLIKLLKQRDQNQEEIRKFTHSCFSTNSYIFISLMCDKTT